MRPGVRADRMALLCETLEDVRIECRVLADGEEDRLRAMISQRLHHSRRGAEPRTVIEREHDFAAAQKVVHLEMLEAKARTAAGINLHRPRHAERIGIARAGLRLRDAYQGNRHYHAR